MLNSYSLCKPQTLNNGIATTNGGGLVLWRRKGKMLYKYLNPERLFMPQIPVPVSEPLSTVDLSELPVLRAIVEGTVQATGEDFLQLLVRNLCIATTAANGFIAEFADDRTRVKSLAFWMNGKLIANQEWELAGPPHARMY